MNVDEMVRSARPDDSTGWARSNGGRRVLDEVIATAPAIPAATVRDSGRIVRERSVTRGRALRWSVVGTGLVGAAAAVALAVPAIVANPHPEGLPAVGALPGTSGGATTVTARDLLLAAATTAEQAPAETGKYWHVKTLNVFGPLRVGSKSNMYWVVRRSVEESWDAGDPKNPSWNGRRDAGTRPRAEADENAWRAAGSPTTWTIDSDGSKVVLSTAPDAGEL
jgi:hypothetical protein